MAQNTRPIPRAPGWDATLGFRRRPYTYIADVCRGRGADAVRTRLFLRPAVLMSGPEATRLFYDQDRFVRHGAMPPRPRPANSPTVADRARGRRADGWQRGARLAPAAGTDRSDPSPSSQGQG